MLKGSECGKGGVSRIWSGRRRITGGMWMWNWADAERVRSDGASGFAAWQSVRKNRHGDKHEVWSLPEVMSSWMCTEGSEGWRDVDEGCVDGAPRVVMCHVSCARLSASSCQWLVYCWSFSSVCWNSMLLPDAISLKLDLSLPLWCLFEKQCWLLC